MQCLYINLDMKMDFKDLCSLEKKMLWLKKNVAISQSHSVVGSKEFKSYGRILPSSIFSKFKHGGSYNTLCIMNQSIKMSLISITIILLKLIRLYIAWWSFLIYVGKYNSRNTMYAFMRYLQIHTQHEYIDILIW